VEERRGESTTLRPLEVPPGWQEIRLGSETAGEGRFYRVLERVAGRGGAHGGRPAATARFRLS
jgi:hypothetical protein